MADIMVFDSRIYGQHATVLTIPLMHVWLHIRDIYFRRSSYEHELPWSKLTPIVRSTTL